jgi:hypothetical protein
VRTSNPTLVCFHVCFSNRTTLDKEMTNSLHCFNCSCYWAAGVLVLRACDFWGTENDGIQRCCKIAVNQFHHKAQLTQYVRVHPMNVC